MEKPERPNRNYEEGKPEWQSAAENLLEAAENITKFGGDPLLASSLIAKAQVYSNLALIWQLRQIRYEISLTQFKEWIKAREEGRDYYKNE